MALRNFKITLEYDGTNFSGWQTQTSEFRTVQAHLEEKLFKIFKVAIHCHASGRTDQGVHAIGQVAHFKVDTDLSIPLIFKAINTFLDRDVSVIKIKEVPLTFHAQRDATTKTYRYTILNREAPSALLRDRAYYYPEPLNIALMRKAALLIKGKKDFKYFQSKSERSPIKRTVRTIQELTIVKQGDVVHITVTSDGFLYKMVRNIISVLIAVGSEKITYHHVADLILSLKKEDTLKPAPSQGLCLMAVKYH